MMKLCKDRVWSNGDMEDCGAAVANGSDKCLEHAGRTPRHRAAHYSERFPKYPPLAYTDEWLYGIWEIGANYRATNPSYGTYPPSYLKRVHTLFPEASKVLHLFSGGLTSEVAWEIAQSAKHDAKHTRTPTLAQLSELELVDSKGPDEGRYPTHQGDVTDLPDGWESSFDLVIADPPYSAEYCKKYGVKSVPAAKVLREAARVTAPGGNLVWLDQKRPMFRKDQWRLWGAIGLIRSTNHRVRLVSIFERKHETSERFRQFFKFGHLPLKLQDASAPICEVANKMIDELPECPEKTAGLLKLLGAKGCFVRAALDDQNR